ncbi:MAG: hypothetical protein KGK03_05365 [Candidatus Omnitrophica bacterium]|nr:hypothetical protein [Candidatus Omnitrophota bacterium]MDE2222485.1 hypothetical protein [Candidatus Omnitrophota bacterium]
MLNKFGKTLTIFIILIVILLMASTSIGFYLYQLEKRMYKNEQGELDNSRADVLKLQTELKNVQGQLTLVEDKNKEDEQKINNLLDERDLNEGLRAALKKENAGLKDQLASLTQAREKMKADLDDAASKLTQYQQLLKTSEDKSKELEAKLSSLTQSNQDMQARINALSGPGVTPAAGPQGDKSSMELGKIVVGSQNGNVQGKILSVDSDAEFVIFNLGLKQGIRPDDILGVYRDNKYLGDIKAARVQDEMSAADIIPPLVSKDVHKNDTVVLKP